jgi:predicted permease
MQIIVEQIIILVIIGFVGLIAFKLKAITRENCNGLVKVILKITLPLLVFTTFAKTELNAEIMSNFPYIMGSAIFCVTVLYFLSKGSAKLQKLDKENTALHNAHTMFGNVAFLGFPLLNALFQGGEGLIYASIFQITHDTLMWTWGIFILNNGSNQKSAKTWTHIINPTTIALLIGILFMIFEIKIPYIILEPLNGLGHTTIYLSMIYVGAILAGVKVKPLITNIRSYILSFNKLILGAIILMGITYLLVNIGFKISQKAIICSVLQAAMPCMIIISVLAEELGLNAKQAVENIFISSVLSIITLPLIYYFTTLIF